jgi:hypothetical protein
MILVAKSKRMRTLWKKQGVRYRTGRDILRIKNEVGLFKKKSNKYSVSIQLEEFLDQLRMFCPLKRAKVLAVICQVVSIPVSYSESLTLRSVKDIFYGFPFSLCIPYSKKRRISNFLRLLYYILITHFYLRCVFRVVIQCCFVYWYQKCA